jgi:cytochrome bd ubiquinol oxidase subunit I
MLMTPSGFEAVLFGWFTAEIGRQPYVVYGHLRTADAVSPITAQAVTISLTAFVVAYAFVFGFGSYYLAKLLRKGPEPLEEAIRGPDYGDRLDRKPKRPFSVASEGIETGERRLPPQPAQ